MDLRLSPSFELVGQEEGGLGTLLPIMHSHPSHKLTPWQGPQDPLSVSLLVPRGVCFPRLLALHGTLPPDHCSHLPFPLPGASPVCISFINYVWTSGSP